MYTEQTKNNFKQEPQTEARDQKGDLQAQLAADTSRPNRLLLSHGPREKLSSPSRYPFSHLHPPPGKRSKL